MGRPITKPQARDAIYLKRQFDSEIIVLCVRWYITDKLSYRDLVEMMAERGVVMGGRWAVACRGVGVSVYRRSEVQNACVW
jgi:hypothetical protein